MKYNINGFEFSNKNDIINKVRLIIDKFFNKKIDGSDYDFIMNIIKYHPNFENKIKNIDYLYVDYDHRFNRNKQIFIKYKNGTIDDISYHKCIRYIPFSEDMKIDYIFKFGKYKGISIYEINDNNYLEWICSININRGDKILINQFLRFGYIPYNPVMYKKIK